MSQAGHPCKSRATGEAQAFTGQPRPTLCIYREVPRGRARGLGYWFTSPSPRGRQSMPAPAGKLPIGRNPVCCSLLSLQDPEFSQCSSVSTEQQGWGTLGSPEAPSGATSLALCRPPKALCIELPEQSPPARTDTCRSSPAQSSVYPISGSPEQLS